MSRESDPRKQRFERAARYSLGAAIVVAVGFAIAFPAIAVDDSASYVEPARSLAQGRGLPNNMERLPAFPVLLAGVIWLLGQQPVVFSLLNVACHVAAVLVVRRTLKGACERRILDVVSAVTIVYPPFLTSAGLILQEPFIALLLAIVFWASWQALEKPGLARSLMAGAALGLAALAKSTALPLIVPASLAVWRVRVPSALRGASVVLGAALFLIPWGARNSLVNGRFQLTNSNGGVTLLGGTVTNSVEAWWTLPEVVSATQRWEEKEQARYPVRDRYFYRVAFDRILESPGHWFRLVIERVVRFMLPARHWFFARGLSRPASISPIYLLAALFQGFVFATVAWLGLHTLRRRRPWTLLVGPVIVFSHLLLYSICYASPRYNVTVGPVLFGALALAICEWRIAHSGGRSTSP